MPATPLSLLGPAVDAERFEADGLSWYAAGSGAPLLLVHSVNAAASVAEVRPLFERASRTRTVFALDLPGYGFSARRDIEYTPRLMTDALHTMVHHIRQQCGDQAIAALALSLGCEFLARAAVEQPAHWGPLALVSPTGFMGRRAWRGAPGSTRKFPLVHGVLSQPLWAERLFRGLTRPGVVRYFLQRTWGGKAIDETMWAYAVATAQQPGAHHAPLHFLGGGLFSADIHDVYEAVTQPVWMSHGVRGDFTDYRSKTLVAGRPNWQFSIFDSGAMPYFEHPQTFMPALDAFLVGKPLPAPAGEPLRD